MLSGIKVEQPPWKTFAFLFFEKSVRQIKQHLYGETPREELCNQKTIWKKLRVNACCSKTPSSNFICPSDYVAPFETPLHNAVSIYVAYFGERCFCLRNLFVRNTFWKSIQKQISSYFIIFLEIGKIFIEVACFLRSFEDTFWN